MQLTTNHYFILSGIGLVFLIFIIYQYNTIISAKNLVHETKASIDTVLKNRFDLIPNLVACIKGYMSHEAEVLEKIAELRSSIVSTQNKEEMEKQFGTENKISGTLKSLFAVAESYPDLKANKNFLQLQFQLVELEDRLQAARRTYNAAIKDIRDLQEQFPSNVIALLFVSIPPFAMFTATEEEKIRPTIGI